MIVKGIIESVVDRDNIKVRVPFLNGLADQVDSTPTINLPNAALCQLPNVSYKLHTGDIVWLNFENTKWESPVIVGFLDIKQDTTVSYKAEEIEVTQQAILPTDTKIGDVDSESLSCLKELRTELAPYFANSMQVYPLDLTPYKVNDIIPLSVMQSIPDTAFVIATTLSDSGSLVYWQLVERSEIQYGETNASAYDNPQYDYSFYNPVYGVLQIKGREIISYGI